jgi:hypothetical protein
MSTDGRLYKRAVEVGILPILRFSLANCAPQFLALGASLKTNSADITV